MRAAGLAMLFAAGVLPGQGLPDTSPLRTATAGAYFTRLAGNHALGMNPANLGYYGARLGPDSGRATVVPEGGTAQGESLEAVGYRDARTATEALTRSGREPAPRVSLTLTGAGAELGNNAVYPTWINEQLFGGLDLREAGQKEAFLAVFPADVWKLNVQAELNSLSLAVGNLGIGLVRPSVISTFELPRALMDVLFRGVRFDQPRDVSNLNLNLLAAAPVSVAYGRQLDIPPLMGGVDRLYAGAGVNILLGLAEVHFMTDRLDIITTHDSVLIEGRTRLVTTVDPESSGDDARGIGASVDLGLAADINARLSVSLALKDLFGAIRWQDRFTTVNDFSLRLSAEEIDDISGDYQSQLDSLKQRYAEPDSTYASGPVVSAYPAQLIVGAALQLTARASLDAALLHYLGSGFPGEVAPQLSLGIEYAATPALPLYFGVGVGGRQGIKWGAGFTLNLGPVQWTVGLGQSGGVFNGARGASLATEIRLVY